ncbi:MAG: polysaccharide deacetylase family protein [Candidatus Cloacimonetes bacterium]|nr:polysaccharide deacetylase family protein [Candidatus Cloacimonadota bacterium]MCF7814852.1 polysaccharide deacetylase family protein [Candidatus Cloacimonadota bacterium]MCF7867521.1 polysaccharide deacetylase family protein [Candidatus Cloacimonadota bacterium]MCF7882977.1 polysaccharide deacetylase family protein [Candidatus Cloacimonadota bacterium]
MKLKIGIDKLTPGWQIIFQQQAYNTSELALDDDLNDYVCLIITQKPSIEFQKKIDNYTKNGGIIIIDSTVSCYFFKVKFKKKKVSFLIPTKDSIFNELGLVDFYTTFYYLKPYNFKWLDKKLMIQTKLIGSGMIINLPFDLDKLMLDESTKRKKFWADRKELPSEIVSRISKGKIRQLIHKLLYFIHQKKNLPLMRISEFPKPLQSLFMFRVDTDFCSADQANSLYEICKKYNINGTWFVDTKDSSMLKDVYAKMTDQEIGLHCKRHLVFDDYKSNKVNIENGLEDLEKAGIKVEGFAAPFGSWNEDLGKVLEEKKFTYSSEFAVNYDDLPFFPFYHDKSSSVLQIPIFPVSTGRLRRSHFSLEEMWQFYKQYIDECLKRNQPIIIYYHPSHGHHNIIEQVFSYVNDLEIPNLTFNEFSKFWIERKNFSWDAEIKSDRLELKFEKSSNLQLVLEKENEISYFSFQNQIKLKKLSWQRKEAIFIPDDLKRIRKWHWRDVLYNYESNKGKKYHENLSG